MNRLQDVSIVHTLTCAAWWAALAVLTLGLISPDAPAVSAAVIPADWGFIASKSVHLFSYLFMACFASLLPVGSRHRLLLLLTLALHAGLTEFGQTFVPNRTGSIRDVCINLTGLSLGLGLAWLLRSVWSHRPAPQTQPLSATTTPT